MEIKAPAKINLFLNVGRKREDSFHEIISLMVKVSLFDEISIKEDDNIIVEGPDWLPQEDNLVYKATQLLKQHAGTDRGCHIKIKKEIPPGRGLGGGSSDCGTILKALNEFWELRLEMDCLDRMGEKLGSDVNFFLHPGGCLAKGRGEIVEPIDKIAECTNTIIIIDPDIEISTPSVYGKYPGGNLTGQEELDKIIKNYQEGRWSLILRNDLENTVFKDYPVLKDLKNRLINWGTQPLLSGSGSCMFAIVEEKKLAESVSEIIEENFGFKTWLVEALNGE